MKDNEEPADANTYFARQRKKMALRIARAKKSWKLPILLVTLLVFLATCAVVFQQLESDNDKQLYDKYRKRKEFWMLKFNMSEDDFCRFMLDATVINKKGFSGSYRNYWGFYHSFWFTITVITTMGFGQIVPVTFCGRLFCIICALFGIPLNALVLKLVGERISNIISTLIVKVEARFLRRTQHRNTGVKCAVISFTLMVIVICIGGALDLMFDGWTFFDGVYFNFIALSTIGFGDLFPRTDSAKKLDRLGLGNNGKRIFASSLMVVYMIIGLSVTSSVICSILKAIEEASQIKVQWTRRGRLVDALSQRLTSKKQLRARPQVPALPAVDDNVLAENPGTAGINHTVTCFENFLAEESAEQSMRSIDSFNISPHQEESEGVSDTKRRTPHNTKL